MRNIYLEISYVGTHYNGFQSQPQKKTVQDQLEHAIYQLSGESIKVISSGRTDAGVHARLQPVNFFTESSIPAQNWPKALNTYLPNDVVVLKAKEVPPDFHARRSAKKKTYRYTINPGRFVNVFQHPFQLHHPGRLNVEEMRKALPAIVGQHDFTSFCTVRTDKVNRIRTVYEARLEQIHDDWAAAEPERGIIHIYVTGSGFLYNMVRIIVGTLIRIGEGKMGNERMQAILEGKDRALAGPTAPAHGLVLWNVEYDE